MYMVHNGWHIVYVHVNLWSNSKTYTICSWTFWTLTYISLENAFAIQSFETNANLTVIEYVIYDYEDTDNNLCTRQKGYKKNS